MRSLRFFNTLGRELQEFRPLVPGKAGFYGCGPTVYNYAHIGNLRAYVVDDLISRTLRWFGYEVSHVMNITDVGHLSGDDDSGEDKMLRSAQERGQSVLEIARLYTEAFFRDTERLNILRPGVVCKATDHVPEMIALIKRIEANGYTYFAGGNLYFDVSRFPSYGELARLRLDDLQAGARVEIDANKRNPADFVLWFTKSKFENQALVWDSPWGRGYPGWHIECSAMSMKYLGEQFDIHAGGIDHIPIHHTNEIAQSEAATGKKWVSYWLHNEFIVMNSGKMSKSKGGFLTLQTLVDAGYNALDYRYFLLGGHYRSQLQFSYEGLDSARAARRSLNERVLALRDRAGEGGATSPSGAGGATSPSAVGGMTGAGAPGPAASSDPHPTPGNLEKLIGHLSPAAAARLKAFADAMADDLSTPRALAELWGILRDSLVLPAEALQTAFAMDEVLGLGLADLKREEVPSVDPGLAAEIEGLVAERHLAKKAKDWARADAIRDELKNRGIILEDGPSGTVWRLEAAALVAPAGARASGTQSPT
ncbi:MAG: cysteine--tRNA ligase [Treponema sp.]|nr:cysteine--tRNA ligase [Treponema sp.]